MQTLTNIVFPLISMFISIMAVLIEHFKVVAAIQSRLTEVETKTELFWKVVESNVPKLLKMPHTLLKDELLGKMSNGTLNHDEACQLKGILSSEIDNAPKDMVLAYVLVIARVEQITNTKSTKDVKMRK